MNLTKQLQYSAAIVAITTLFTYTNILTPLIANGIIVITFSINYLYVCINRNGISLVTLIPILVSIFIIILNRDLTLVSLALIWMIYDMINYSEFDSSKVAKSFFNTAVIGFIIIIIFYFTTGFNNYANLTMWRIDHLVSRASLGFRQPNASMMYVVAIMMAFVLSYKLTWFKFFSALGISILLFNFNQSRTGFILIIILLILVKLNISWKYPKITMILIACGSYALTILPINMKWNAILSGRLALYQSYKNFFGIHMLGNHVVDSAMIDNGYIQMLLSKGLLFTGVFMLSIIFIMKFDNKLTSILFLIYILSAFTETTFLHLDLLFPVMISLNLTSKSTANTINNRKYIKTTKNERYTLLEN